MEGVAGLLNLVVGALGRVLSYQDTAQVHPCSLFLDVLSRKVLVRQYPPQLQAFPKSFYLKPMFFD